jgi:hypothetical protein
MVENKKIRHALILLLNPSQILDDKKKYKWYLFLLYPSAGWSLFFLQVYLSLHIDSGGALFKMLIVSFALGYTVNLFIGITLTWILRSIKRRIEYDNVISCISLSHTYMFFSLVLGFIYRIFDPSISVSFGVAGVLCTLLPVYSGIRNLGNKNPFAAPLLATYVGVIMLFFWKIVTIINQ